jgi:hypothetical protein
MVNGCCADASGCDGWQALASVVYCVGEVAITKSVSAAAHETTELAMTTTCVPPTATSVSLHLPLLAHSILGGMLLTVVTTTPRHPDPDCSPVEQATRAAAHGAAAALWFLAVGGRYRTIPHSSLMYPGAHARESIVARPFVYADTKERTVINHLGRTHGCHTCGHRPLLSNFFGRSYNADHQPPNKFISPPTYFTTPIVRFYPQCTQCSNSQGGAAMRASGRNVSIPLISSHFSAYGLPHLWLPTSVIVDQAITNANANATA